ncbi:MAG: type II toxin-antitoxin system HicA family toxin [Desulfovibrio sp.]|nr:type II toxin-antitoxin system HicA family toxin [Desulfovibrio sp.]
MNSGQRKTLAAIFATPIPKNLIWADIESLFIALGCELCEGSGSRVAFRRDGKKADFHRPHPGKEAKPYQVRDAREFLIRLGERP